MSLRCAESVRYAAARPAIAPSNRAYLNYTTIF